MSNSEKKLKKAQEHTEDLPDEMFGEEKATADDLPKLGWEEKENAKRKVGGIKPILNSFLLLIEEEKKITIKKLEDAKKLLESMKKNR